jgi:hypothetical protein
MQLPAPAKKQPALKSELYVLPNIGVFLQKV